ncbi:MAG: hypothetical protein K2H75_05345 [Muribaculaceae bacterium]|nr:hypothetical protein [Muribaculaceae bacterium]
MHARGLLDSISFVFYNCHVPSPFLLVGDNFQTVIYAVGVPDETVHTGKVTEARVEVPVNDYNKYSYCVQGYFSTGLMGAVSEEIDVNVNTSVSGLQNTCEGKVYAANGMLSLANPDGLMCEIYTLDDKCIYTTSAKSSQVRLAKGMYVVRIGDKSFKVLN